MKQSALIVAGFSLLYLSVGVLAKGGGRPASFPGILWKKPLEGHVGLSRFQDGKAYLHIFHEGSDFLQVIKLGTGQELWRFEVGEGSRKGSRIGSLQVEEGMVLIREILPEERREGKDVTDTLENGDPAATKESGLVLREKLHVLDQATGRKLGEFKPEEAFFGEVEDLCVSYSPLRVEDGKAWFPARSGLYVLDLRDFRCLWKYETRIENYGPEPWFQGGLCYFAKGEHYGRGGLTALDAQDGQIRWQNKSVSPKCMDDQFVYVSSDGEMLSALDPVTGEVAWTLAGGMEPNEVVRQEKGERLFFDKPGNEQSSYCALNHATGDLLWEIRDSGIRRWEYFLEREDKVWLLGHRMTEARGIATTLYAVDLLTGEILGQAPMSDVTGSTGAVNGAIAYFSADDGLWVVDMRSLDCRKVVELDDLTPPEGCPWGVNWPVRIGNTVCFGKWNVYYIVDAETGALRKKLDLGDHVIHNVYHIESNEGDRAYFFAEDRQRALALWAVGIK